MKKLLLLVLLIPNLLLAQYCTDAFVIVNLDQYPSETSWQLADTTGTVLYSGGPYTGAPFYSPQVTMLCLPHTALEFTIFDLYGDGLAGSLWGGQDGSYYVVQCGDTLVYGDVANFGYDSSHVFISEPCPPPPIIPGCMDSLYFEYMPNATVDDGSCLNLIVVGCLDTNAFNYDPLANTMDFIDSCTFDLYLHDLVGNGWVGSRLEIYQGGDTSVFVMTNSGNSQLFNIDLNAPELVEAKFFINQQAFNTLVECGFTLLNPLGDTIMSVVPPFLLPFNMYWGGTYCGDECIEVVEGCMDSLAFNYVDTANTNDFCYYNPGCTSPAYLAYHVDTAMGIIRDYNNQDSCLIGGLAVFGCTDFLAYNYNPLANVDVGCLPFIYGCMDVTMYNYDPLATAPDTCIPFIYGCTDPASFNYNPLANSDNGSCIPFIYGCTDSTAFNYNPLANADNSSCIPYIYGCTDPSALNYSAQANTEDFSCIAYVYGCMDSLAINFDSLANTDNGSCISIIMGCMDQTAYNYNADANTDDPLSCNYSANCITGDSIPYWLNDPCYAWVIEVDNYCCDNEWDEVCQATYNYCEGTWVGPLPKRMANLIMITDLLGRPAKMNINQLLFFIYDDGTVEKKILKKQ